MANFMRGSSLGRVVEGHKKRVVWFFRVELAFVVDNG